MVVTCFGVTQEEPLVDVVVVIIVVLPAVASPTGGPAPPTTHAFSARLASRSVTRRAHVDTALMMSASLSNNNCW
jgi:hypothetical protein